MTLFFFFIVLDGVKPNADRKELANNNAKNPDNKSSINIENLVQKKNFNQNGNISVQEQEETKVVGTITGRAILSNLYLYKHSNSKSKTPANVLDL